MSFEPNLINSRMALLYDAQRVQPDAMLQLIEQELLKCYPNLLVAEHVFGVSPQGAVETSFATVDPWEIVVFAPFLESTESLKFRALGLQYDQRLRAFVEYGHIRKRNNELARIERISVAAGFTDLSSATTDMRSQGLKGAYTVHRLFTPRKDNPAILDVSLWHPTTGEFKSFNGGGYPS